MISIFKKIASYSSRIPQIYGTLITFALILYFFIIYAVGFIHVTELRVVNMLIQIVGIYFAIKQYRTTHAGTLNYLRAMTIGAATSFIASSTFALFLFIFLQVDQNLMNLIRENAPLGAYLDPNIASFSVFLEGVFSGIMATFILVNFLRTDNVNTDRIEEPSVHGALGDS